MPIVMCQFCEYVGSTNVGPGQTYSLDDLWYDVEDHEKAEHPEDLDDLEANPE